MELLCSFTRIFFVYSVGLLFMIHSKNNIVLGFVFFHFLWALCAAPSFTFWVQQAALTLFFLWKPFSFDWPAPGKHLFQHCWVCQQAASTACTDTLYMWQKMWIGIIHDAPTSNIRLFSLAAISKFCKLSFRLLDVALSGCRPTDVMVRSCSGTRGAKRLYQPPCLNRQYL